MKIKVLFFGLTQDLTGLKEEVIDVGEGEDVASLRGRYAQRFPRLSDLGDSLLFALNEELTGPTSPLHDGDEVAFMPPVSGGLDGGIYAITRDVIRVSELAASLKRACDGAVVIFEGVVREQSQGRRTLYLEYEAYEPMAIRSMEEIGEEAKLKFAVDRVGIVHRIGKLDIGETSVAIVVSAAHRKAAFEACHYAIDRLKQTAPIWKKEYFEDGAVWAEGESQRRVLVEAKK
jgi:MoaE-MoaD fusion protein